MLKTDDGQLIVDEFGLGSHGVLEGPVARGEVGQVWRLTTPDGMFAIKEPFKAPKESATDDEAIFQELGIAAGVPAPRIVRTQAGRVLAHVRGVAIRVYEWVDLYAPDRNLDPVAVADAVAQLHRVAYSGRNGLDPWYTDPIGEDRWRSLVVDLVEAGAPFAETLGERLDELIALERWIETPTEVRTCHRDLFADNVLATATGGVCIIDWENSGMADPSQELAVVLFEFAGHDARRGRDIYSTYRDRGGPGVVDRHESFSMCIAQLGHIGYHSARRWLVDPRAVERDRNAARVEEFLDDGITRSRIEMLLNSVAP